MNTSRFGSTIDLGQLDFNFSCKIYHTKVYTTFTKVVALYKIQAKHIRLEESFANRPSETFEPSQPYPFAKYPHRQLPDGGGELTAGDEGTRRETSGPGL
jgi:hypothetical protein